MEYDALAEFDILFGQAVALHLLGYEELSRYVELFNLGIAGYTYYLHPVEERIRDALKRIRSRYEHNIRKVVVAVKVVVVKCMVLLRVQHLKERARRVSAEIAAHLIYLV